MVPSWAHFPRHLAQSDQLGLQSIDLVMFNREPTLTRETTSIKASLEIMEFQTLKTFEHGFSYGSCVLQESKFKFFHVIPLDWLHSWDQTPKAPRQTTHTWGGSDKRYLRLGPHWQPSAGTQQNTAHRQPSHRSTGPLRGPGGPWFIKSQRGYKRDGESEAACTNMDSGRGKG